MRVIHGSNSANDYPEHPPYSNRLAAYGLGVPRHATQRATARPRSVWLTCTDDLLAPVMRRLEQSGSAIVLRVHRSFSNLLDVRKCDVGSRLDGAVSLSCVDELVVAGHGMCTSILRGARPIGQDPGERGMPQLIERIARRQKLNRRSRELLADQVAVLQRRLSVAHAIQERGLTVCGMWYVQETGLWIRYTAENGWIDTTHFA